MGLVRLIGIIALAIAFLIATNVLDGGNFDGWLSGGLLACWISATHDYVLPLGPRAAPPA